MLPLLRTTLLIPVCLSLFGSGAALAAADPKAPAMAASKSGPASAWTVDRANSKIRFKSSAGGAAFEGGFSRWDAQINFDPKNLAGSKASVTVDLASATSGDATRDQTLPTADWFNVPKFPRATFSTTSIKDLGGGRYEAAGALTLRGVSRPVTMPFTLSITGQTAKMVGQVSLNRSQFGVGQGQFSTADTVPFEVVVPVTVVAKKAG